MSQLADLDAAGETVMTVPVMGDLRDRRGPDHRLARLFLHDQGRAARLGAAAFRIFHEGETP